MRSGEVRASNGGAVDRPDRPRQRSGDRASPISSSACTPTARFNSCSHASGSCRALRIVRDDWMCLSRLTKCSTSISRTRASTSARPCPSHCLPTPSAESGFAKLMDWFHDSVTTCRPPSDRCRRASQERRAAGRPAHDASSCVGGGSVYCRRGVGSARPPRETREQEAYGGACLSESGRRRGLGMTMREVLDALDLGFAAKGRGNTEMPPKPGIHTRPDCFIHAMPAYVQELEVAGLKWVSGYPPNPAKGLPYISGLLVLNDCETGLPLAVMDCAWITAMRTGASAGISAKYLARAGSDTAAIVGCGVQARTSLMALVESCRPSPRCAATTSSPRRRRASSRRWRPCSRRCASRPARPPPRPCTRPTWWSRRCPSWWTPSPTSTPACSRRAGLAVSLDYDSAWTGAAMRGVRQVLLGRRRPAAGDQGARRVLRRHPRSHQCRPWRVGRGPQAGARRATPSVSSR